MSWNEPIIQEFRTNNGQIGGPFEGASLLLLITAGRRTGRPHTNPVVYLQDGSRYLIFATNAGGPHHPDWYHNLRADPQVTVELGSESGQVGRLTALATPLESDEREEMCERQCSADPGFRDHQEQSTRTIPVVALYPVDVTSDRELGNAAGEQLLHSHDELGDQLDSIRSRLATLTDETDRLRRDSLRLCYGLQIHHLREDGVFPAMEAAHPVLAPVVDQLRRQHQQVEEGLDRMARFLEDGSVDGTTLVQQLPHHLDRLEASLEGHFAYEEENLLPALGVATR